MEKHIHVPFIAEELADLRAGDTVLLSGVIYYFARLRRTKRMIETLDSWRCVACRLARSAHLLRRTDAGETWSGHRLHWADDIQPHGCFCATTHG